MSSLRALRIGLPARACFTAYHVEIIVKTRLGIPIAIPAFSPGVRPSDDVLELDGVAVVLVPVMET